MKKKIIIIVLLLLIIPTLSSCSSHKSENEAVAWFYENIVDEPVVIESNYYEVENDSGYTDRVWPAHLKNYPDVKFELISHASYSLFPTYTMQTTFYYHLANYYLDLYRQEDPDFLKDCILEESAYSARVLVINGIYDSLDSLHNLSQEMAQFNNYIKEQELPCRLEFGLAYLEPLTFMGDNFHFRDTYYRIFNDDEDFLEDDISTYLELWAKRKWATYAAAYRLDLELFDEDELSYAVVHSDNYRFTISRENGYDIVYPELLSFNGDYLSFGTLYEVLLREGQYNLSGNPQNYQFTAIDGSYYEINYEYVENRQFYILQNGEKMVVGSTPFIYQDLFNRMTGLSFKGINEY